MSPPLPKRPQSGFTLLEASLGLGAAAVLGLAALGLYRSSDATAKVRLEQAHISALAQAIESSLGIVGSFASVSVERVVEDQLVPATLLQGNTLRNAWGGPVEVAPYAFTQPNDSFAVVYGSVPAKACADLGSALSNQVSDLKVNGQSTLLDGTVDPALLAQRCSNGGTMLFVFHTGLASGTAVAVTPVTNPPPVDADVFHDVVWHLIDRNALVNRVELGEPFADLTVPDEGDSRWHETFGRVEDIHRRRPKLPWRHPKTYPEGVEKPMHPAQRQHLAAMVALKNNRPMDRAWLENHRATDEAWLAAQQDAADRAWSTRYS